MFDKVIETYRCLISCREKMPGMKLEDAFSFEALQIVKKEYAWLIQVTHNVPTKKYARGNDCLKQLQIDFPIQVGADNEFLG